MSNDAGHKSHVKSGRHSHDRYLSFALGKEEYALPLLAVREVIAMPEFTPVPFSPPHFLGIMNLRGQVISVIDLRLKLGVKPSGSNETAVIICDLANVCLGVVVDAIVQVIAPEPGELSDKPEMTSGVSAEYITRIYRRPDALVMLIDIARALGVSDLAHAANASALPLTA
jgi:purine-binding chemotaxis protein CheW